MVLGLFNSPVSFRNQKFDELKRHCIDQKKLFVDPEFPPNDSSLFYSNARLANIMWKRPQELCSNPKLFVDGASSTDVTQGRVGNCWFVAACSALALEKELWLKVIPDSKEQEWNDDKKQNYAGIFHFRFWRFGEWIDVVIDDYIPTINGQLIFIHSKTRNEFWSALLEKAYAKLSGSYESLDGGNLTDALVDFTGGVAETTDLREGKYTEDEAKRQELFRTMRAEAERRSLMCCAINVTNKEEMETRTDVGLIKGHAYSITSVKKVYIGDTGLLSFFRGREKLYMIRLRNPWGEKEWTGSFSDGSPEWNKINKSQREKMGLTFEDDGEFWMTFDDYCKHFTDMSICHLLNTSIFNLGKTWHESVIFGKWTTGPQGTAKDRAGGCLNNKDTFLRNPQYCLDIASDEDHVLISLQQKDKRESKKLGETNLIIGFHIMKVELNRRFRVHSYKEKAAASDYMKTRSVFLRYSLKKGRYVIFPTTFSSGDMGDFMLRIYANTDPAVKLLIQDLPESSMWPCIRYPCSVTTVTVRSASGLEKQDRQGGADPYCIIKCEGEKVKTPIIKDSLSPTWNSSAIFYRKNISSPVKVQVWNYNVVLDQYMGKAEFRCPANNQTIVYEGELFGRKREKGVRQPGKLVVEISCSDDLNTL